MRIEIVGDISHIETIAIGRRIRELPNEATGLGRKEFKIKRILGD